MWRSSRRGESLPACEFGSLVSLAKNDDGMILSHQDYHRNMADVKTLGQVIAGIKRNTGHCPEEVTADRGFDQSLKKQENCRGLIGGRNTNCLGSLQRVVVLNVDAPQLY